MAWSRVCEQCVEDPSRSSHRGVSELEVVRSNPSFISLIGDVYGEFQVRPLPLIGSFMNEVYLPMAIGQ